MRTESPTHEARWIRDDEVQGTEGRWRRFAKRAQVAPSTESELSRARAQSPAQDELLLRSLRVSGRRAMQIAVLVGIILCGVIWSVYTIRYYDLVTPPDQPIMTN